MAMLAELGCHLMQERGVGGCVDVRAETGASWIESTRARGLEGESGRASS